MSSCERPWPLWAKEVRLLAGGTRLVQPTRCREVYDGADDGSDQKEYVMGTWERAMLAWPNGERCERSRETLETARRLRRWRDVAERCANCRKRAVAVCGREAFCATCQAQRAARVLEKRRGIVAAASGNGGAVVTGTESGGILRGHAIVFGALSLDLGGFVEIIRPSAVDRMIAEKTDLRRYGTTTPRQPSGA